MEELIKMAIEKFILPHFPSIVDYSLTSEKDKTYTHTFAFNKPINIILTKYRLIYFFKNEESRAKNAHIVRGETQSLFEMLGPSNDEKLEISYLVKK